MNGGVEINFPAPVMVKLDTVEVDNYRKTEEKDLIAELVKLDVVVEMKTTASNSSYFEELVRRAEEMKGVQK